MSFTFFRQLQHILLVVFVLAALQPGEKAEAADKSGLAQATVNLHTRTLALKSGAPKLRNIGALYFLGGIELEDPTGKIGGLSGIIVGNDNRLLAVSDAGFWFSGLLDFENGQLAGLENSSIAPLLDAQRNLLADPDSDAEAVTALDETGMKGRLLVSFERNDRVLMFDVGAHGLSARGETFKMPQALAALAYNQGLEGITALDGVGEQILALSEYTLDENKNIRGWLITPNAPDETAFAALSLRRLGDFHLTDLARLPNGDILTLERRFNLLSGVGCQLRLISQDRIKAHAVLDGPLIAVMDGSFNIDNMEGLAVRAGPQGSVEIFILSDDNFSALQRTLLLHFRLDAGALKQFVRH